MLNQKRRVIYMSDDEWAYIAQCAKDHALTISAEIRGRVLMDWRDHKVVNSASPQAQRDAILRRINK